MPAAVRGSTHAQLADIEASARARSTSCNSFSPTSTLDRARDQFKYHSIASRPYKLVFARPDSARIEDLMKGV
jgi:hypothetical protein